MIGTAQAAPAMAGVQPETSSAEPSAWEGKDAIPWERDLLTLFVRNQLRVSFALPLLALALAAASLLWIHWSIATAWFACVIGVQAVQLHFCRIYERSESTSLCMGEWIGILAATEFFYAACWTFPLFTFWQAGDDFQHIFLIATLMVVVAVRIMIAANFMPVIMAGTGFITFIIVIRCLLEQDPLYVALGAIAIIAEIFFVQLARRLQATAKDMLIFKSQKERLIVQLQLAMVQAEQARERAEDASRAKSRFLATMSHELRTPLNAIMGFSEILSHEMMGPHAVSAYKNYSKDIHHSGHYLLNLINDILDLSRIEAGRHQLHTEPVDIIDEAQECLKMIEFKAKERNQTVVSQFAADLPKVSADKRAIRQIWLNLISNAVKFSPAGSEITLKVRRLDNSNLQMTVEDNGPGMGSSEISTVMTAFTRGDMATRKAIDGAGLGLPIVHGLVKLHGAELAIDSSEGKGTRVSISFPASLLLDNPRAEVLNGCNVKSASQRRLIAVTA